MDKPEVGLPQNFSIKVQKPVEIGDYLDETTIPSTSGLAEVDLKIPPTAQLPNSNPQPQQLKAQKPKPESTPQAQTPSQSAKASTKPRRKPRRQINMSLETVDKFNEIISYVQDFGPQGDAAASEIWEAIINAHHESLPPLRFGSIRPRGPWGSPTANAFKHALSRAFAKSIIDYEKK